MLRRQNGREYSDRSGKNRAKASRVRRTAEPDRRVDSGWFAARSEPGPSVP